MSAARHSRTRCLVATLAVLVSSLVGAAPLATVEELTAALANQKDGDVIELAEGTFSLTSTIELTAGVTLTGAGRGKTILTRDASVASMRIARLNHKSAVLEKVTVRDGYTTGNAAGIQVDKGVVRDCEVVNCGTFNWSGKGGSVVLASADAKMYRTILHGNSSSSYLNPGGMVVRLSGGALMESCLVYDNKNTYAYAYYTVYVENGTVRHCTIVDNLTPNTCAVYLAGTSSKIYDSIVCDNLGTSATVNYTLGNGFDIAAANASALANVFNCVTDNPVFADEANRDYRLHAASSCVDAGQYGEAATTETDVNGANRIQNGVIDIGACETTPGTAAVLMKASTLLTAAGTTVTFTLRSSGVSSPSYTVDFGDGTSETTSAGTLTHVYATQGSCTPSVTLGTLSYTLPNAIVIRPAELFVREGATGTEPYDDWGKAAGYLEDALQYAADGSTIWIEDSTDYTFKEESQILIDKAIRVKGVSGDPTKVVISCKTVSKHKMFRLAHAGAELSGLTISGGYSSSGQALAGSDVYIEPQGGMVTNCILTGVVNSGWGAHGVALAMRGGIVTHSKIVDNSVSSAGSDSKCYGAFVYASGGTIANSIISGNSGGGADKATCGGVVGLTDACTLVNCVVANNTMTGCAGIYFGNATPRVYNTIVAGNVSTGCSGDYIGIYNRDSSASYADCFVNCAATKSLNDTCQAADDLGLVDLANDDFHLVATSVCRNHGTTEGIAVEATDIEGNPRVDESGQIDIGAYEFAVSGIAATIAASPARDEYLVPVEITFTAATEGAAVAEYQWFMDDVRDTAATGATYKRSFTEAGTHVVSLKVSDGTTLYDASNVITVKGFPKELYVVPSSSEGYDPDPPYDSWGKASSCLEDVIQYATSGSTVWIKDGTDYTFKEAAQISIEKAIRVKGVSGDPTKVVIRCKTEGKHKMFALNDPGAELSGLTISGGRGSIGGDVYIGPQGGMVTNCILTGAAGNIWGSYGVALAMRGGIVTHSKIVDNSDSSAGSDKYYGAFVYACGGTIANSIISGNSGGGSDKATYGGVVGLQDACSLVNCVVANNTMTGCAGICFYNATPRVYNTIVVGNVSTGCSGDYIGIYNRDSSASYADCFVNCAATKYLNGTCQAADDLGLMDLANDDFHILGSSVCRNHGTTEGIAIEATDIEGNPRIDEESDTIDIGAYEFHLKGLSASISASPVKTEGIVPVALTFTASVEGGEVAEYRWFVNDVRDTAATGATYARSFTEPGTFVVSLQVSDGTTLYDASNVITVKGYPKTLYVVPPTTEDHQAVAPYDSWTKAATNIADAVAAAYDGGEILVGGGINIVTNTLSVSKAITIRGATGKPGDAVLRSSKMSETGWQSAFGPVVLLNNADSFVANLSVEGGACRGSSGGNIGIGTLGGTVSNCFVRTTLRSIPWGARGGGVYMQNGLVTHCIISNCLASTWGQKGHKGYSGGSGAFITGGEMRETLLIHNGHDGVGASDVGDCGTVRMQGGKIVNCTLADNQSLSCSGIFIDTTTTLGTKTTGEAVNCIVSGNLLTYSDGTSWVTVPTNLASVACGGQTANFKTCLSDTEEPINATCLVEPSAQTFKNPKRDNFRIRSDSAARDAGQVRTDAPAADLRGDPRIFGQAIDIGCYESQAGGFLLIVR